VRREKSDKLKIRCVLIYKRDRCKRITKSLL